ncbi:MAG: AAA family ATPase [Planctomycetota bacterium]
MAEKYVCDKYEEHYISDGKLGYGKGTRLVVNEIKRYLTKLSAQGIGVVLIAHATTKAIESRTGTVTKQIPLIPGDNKREELYNAILASADLIGFVDQERVQANGAVETHQVLRLRPDPSFEAGDRSGRLPPVLPLSWAALQKAYAVDQEQVSKTD